MKLDFNLIMKIFNAIQTVEATVKGSAAKKAKAIAIITEGADLAGSFSPKAKAKIGEVIDATVEIHNGLAGRE